jgi:hypothetical protein
MEGVDESFEILRGFEEVEPAEPDAAISRAELEGDKATTEDHTIFDMR